MPDGLCARTPLTSARAIAVASPSASAVEPRLRRSARRRPALRRAGRRACSSVRSIGARRGRPTLSASCPWQCLYFLPEPHGHGALRLIGASTTSPSARAAAAAAAGCCSGGRLDSNRAVAGVDVGRVVVARERVDVLGDEVRQHRRRRRRSSWTCARIRIRVTSSRIAISSRSNSRKASCLYSSIGFFCA